MSRYIVLEGNDADLYKFCGWFEQPEGLFTSDMMFGILKHNNINSIEEFAKVDDKKLSRFRRVGPKRLVLLQEAREYARSLVEQGESPN